MSELIGTMVVDDLGELSFNTILEHYGKMKKWIDNKLIDLEKRVDDLDDRKWVHFHKIINDKEEKIKELRTEVQNIRQERLDKYERALQDNKTLRRLLNTPSMLNND